MTTAAQRWRRDDGGATTAAAAMFEHSGICVFFSLKKFRFSSTLLYILRFIANARYQNNIVYDDVATCGKRFHQGEKLLQ